MVIARSFNNSLPLDNYNFEATRIKCFCKKGFLQYAEFNIKLFIKLLFSKTDYLLSNDLDTLLPNYIVSKVKGKKIFYDTHEYFTGVPELRQSPFKRRVWKTIENWILPKLPIVYTVNNSVKETYEKEYGNSISVIRNVPFTERIEPMPLPEKWIGKKIILMQCAGINVGRGGMELLQAVSLLPDEFFLLYIGSGTEWETIAQKTKEWKLTHRVEMIAKLPPAQLKRYTLLAHIGCSLDSFDDINYLFNLPNKIFDYIHAGVPVIATAIPEVKKIMDEYKCGICIDNLLPATIAESIMQLMDSPQTYEAFKQQCIIAAKDLCWENESEKLKQIYRPYL